MQVIAPANATNTKLLEKFHTDHGPYRLLHHCVALSTEDGQLLFNLLTREMVLLSEAEWENRLENDYLKRHWFLVPQDCKEKEYADLIRWVLTSRKSPAKNITGYTIFPTTDCNARCFYCFELARARTPMSPDTAHKVAAYIADHCGGSARITWFGGEPLLNPQAMDIICQGLRERGVEFTSAAVSNGYLFQKETVAKAKKDWNLNRVQISLDGTEPVYNKVKAYIHREGSPYQRVMENIGHLLDAGVTVRVRLNMDLHNAQDLLALVEELAARFPDRKGLTVYAHPLFRGDEPMATLYDYDEWELRDAAMVRLEETIAAHGLASKSGISPKTRTNFCMADSGRAVTILPGGQIGLCEHFSESEFIGHIHREGFDAQVVEAWKARTPLIPECQQCFYYPDCRQLEKCPSGCLCFEQIRRLHRRKVELQMRNQYRMWKNSETQAQTDEEPIC